MKKEAEDSFTRQCKVFTLIVAGLTIIACILLFYDLCQRVAGVAIDPPRVTLTGIEMTISAIIAAGAFLLAILMILIVISEDVIKRRGKGLFARIVVRVNELWG